MQRYVMGSSGIAVVVGLGLLQLALARGGTAVAWGGLGWLMMSTIGVVGGAWLVSKHGTPGSGFLIVLITCMLARLAASAAGAFGAAQRDLEAIGPYLIGLGAGYLPLQIFEARWFLKRAKSQLSKSRSGAGV